jgi:hypothetical protein
MIRFLKPIGRKKKAFPSRIIAGVTDQSVQETDRLLQQFSVLWS